MTVIDHIHGRKILATEESDGVTLAAYTINQHLKKKYTLKSLKKTYREITGSTLLHLLQEEMDSMIVFYRYHTKIKEYLNRKGDFHLKIELIGKAGMMNRFNPLDIKFKISTETPWYCDFIQKFRKRNGKQDV